MFGYTGSTIREQEVNANTAVPAQLTIAAVVTRCGCGDPLRFHGRGPNGELLPCPRPRAVEDRGVIYDSRWKGEGVFARLRRWWKGG